MIKISQLSPTTANALLANSTAVIPISTGNASFNTFKTTVSSIGEYILSNAGNITSGNINNTGNITSGNITITSNLSITGTVTGNLNALNVITTNANVTNTLIATNISLGNILGTPSASYPNQNNSRIKVRPSMDLNGSGSVSASDLLNWLKIINGTSGGSVSSFNNVPYIVQHVDKPATGIMITNNSILAESLGTGGASAGQIYITSGGSNGFLTSWIRVGGDDYQPGDIFIKGTTVNVAGGITMQQQSYVTSTVDNFSGGTGFGYSQAFNISGALSVNNRAYIGGNTFVRGLVVGNVSTAANGWIFTNHFSANGNVSAGNVIVANNVVVASTGTVTTGNISVSNNTETGLLLSSKYIQSPYPVLSPQKIKNKGTGTFTYVTNLSAGTYPRMIDIDPSGRFLYLTDYSGNVVRQFSINQTDGQLSVITTAIATGTAPWKIKVDPTGRFVYAINNTASTISQYSINQSTGALTSIAAAVAVASGPNGIAIDPTGRFLYVTNSTTSTISQYSINQSTGALTTITTAVATNTGVVDIVADPTGRFVYTTSTNKLAAWNINQSTGELTQINDLTFSGTPAVCKIDPAGRYLYVATVSQLILQFSINQSTGVLTSVNSSVATGNRPIDIAFDPNGWYMYTTNLNDNTLTAFRINQYNGAVSVVSTASSSATGPEGIVVDPTGRFLYATHITSGYVTLYRLNDFALGFTSNINTGNVTATGKVTTENSVVNGLAEIWRANVASIYLYPGWDYIDSGTVSAGSPDPTGGSQCYIDSTGGALAATLGDGTVDGFLKYFFMYVDGGDCTLTVTHAAWKGGASGTVTFNDVGDTCTLQWFVDKWFIMGSYGVTVA